MRYVSLLFALCAVLLSGCGNDELTEKTLTSLPTGMSEELLTAGSGAVPKFGQTASVRYVGTLADGTQFDSSANLGHDFQFVVGAGQVIRGFDAAVQTMKVGQRSKYTIPPELAYGSTGAPPTIPPNATLVFDITLVAVY